MAPKNGDAHDMVVPDLVVEGAGGSDGSGHGSVGVWDEDESRTKGNLVAFALT